MNKHVLAAIFSFFTFTALIFSSGLNARAAVAQKKPEPLRPIISGAAEVLTASANAANQAIGRLNVSVAEDALAVSSIRLKIAVGGNGGRPRDISSIVLKDDRGNIIAQSKTRTSPGGRALLKSVARGRDGRFITLPSGSYAYTIEATLGGAFRAGQIITISTNPLRDWRGMRARTKLLPVMRTHLGSPVVLQATIRK